MWILWIGILTTLHRKFETNIPRNETGGPPSQFLHSCIGERFIYSHDRFAYFALLRLQTDHENIKIVHRYMNGEIGNKAAQFNFWDICFKFLPLVQCICSVYHLPPWIAELFNCELINTVR
jgi:hypothetical protein